MNVVIQKGACGPILAEWKYLSYQLDQSISILRVVGWYISFLSFYKQTVEILIRHRIMAYAMSDLGQHCQCPIKRTLSRLIWIKSN